MKRKIIIVSALVIVIMLSLFAFTACNTSKVPEGQELVTNGNFSTFTDGAFDGWKTVTGASSNFKFGQGVFSDTQDNYLYIDNSVRLYTYLYQRIEVETNRIYKVSVDIMVTGTSDINHEFGAYVGFLENTSNKYKFASQRQHTDEFVTHTFYIRPKNTDYLTLALCLGSSDTGATGHVIFDNVSVTRVDKDHVPSGVDVVNFRKSRAVHGATNAGGITFMVLLSVATAALLFAAYILLRRLYAQKNVFKNFGNFGTPVVTPSEQGATKKRISKDTAINGIAIACAVALVAFIVRLVLLLTTYGFGRPMTETINLADTLAVKNGVFNYYANHSTSTVAPGTLYILAILGFMTRQASYQTASVVFRLVNVLADVAIVLMIYFYGKKRVGNKLATVYSALYALLPFAFAFTGMNNGFETLLAALIVAAMLLALDKQYLATYFVMAIATTVDVRALAIAPIILMYFVYMYIKDDPSLKRFTSHRAQIVFGLLAAFVLVYLVTLPAAINQVKGGKPFFNLTAIANGMINAHFFTSDAFTLYGMVAMNNKVPPTSVNVLNLIFILVLEAYVISLYFKNRNRQEIILLAAFTLAVLSVFTIKVNYTYLFLSLALGFIYTMTSGDKRMYLVMSGYSLLGFLDYGQLLNQSGMISSTPQNIVYETSSTWGASLLSYETTSPYYIIFCVLAVILTGYYVYVTYSITNNTKIVDINGMNETVVASVKRTFKNIKNRLTRKSAAE